jgi:hypothetical protein
MVSAQGELWMPAVKCEAGDGADGWGQCQE